MDFLFLQTGKARDPGAAPLSLKPALRVDLANRQRRHRIRPRKIKKLARWLMTQALAHFERVHRPVVLLVLTDDEGISRLNAEYFGKARATDVITFGYDHPPDNGACAGEIVVNVQRAWTEGRRRGGRSRELAFYIAHGCDHLLGASDRTPLQRGRMHARERGWLKRATRLRLLNDLWDESPRATRKPRPKK